MRDSRLADGHAPQGRPSGRQGQGWRLDPQGVQAPHPQGHRAQVDWSIAQGSHTAGSRRDVDGTHSLGQPIVGVALVRDELSLNRLSIPFVPAEAGTQFFGRVLGRWVPASAGTNGDWFNGGANLISSRSSLAALAARTARARAP